MASERALLGASAFPARWVDSESGAGLCHLVLDDQRPRLELPESSSEQERGRRSERGLLRRTRSKVEDRDQAANEIACSVQREDSHEENAGGASLLLRGRSKAFLPFGSQEGRQHQQRRPPLTGFIYRMHVAPFLRFEAPLPNMLYVIGGRCSITNEILDAVEMFDTWNGRWVARPAMPRRRSAGAAATLPDGRLLAIGGYDERGPTLGALAHCDVFDPALNCWEANGIASMFRARWGHGVAVAGNLVLVAGGCSPGIAGRNRSPSPLETLGTCEIYDLLADRWIPAASLSCPRSGLRLATLCSGRIAAVGGMTDALGSRPQVLSTIEIFDIAHQKWTLLSTTLSVPRSCAAVAAADGEHLFVVGGYTGSPRLLASGEVMMADQKSDSETDAGKNVEGSIFTESARGCIKKLTGLPAGRLGCQAAMISLPGFGKSYPICNSSCFVVVGGETSHRISEEGSDKHLFTSAFDIHLGKWRNDNVLPPPAKPPRTAVALCVGVGRVDP